MLTIKRPDEKRFVILTVLAWTLCLFIVANFAHGTLAKDPWKLNLAQTFEGKMKLLTPFVRYDSLHFLRISNKGYVDAYKGLIAFLPGFSFLVRILSTPLLALTHDSLVANVVTGLVMNLTFLIFSLFMAKRLFERDFGDKISLGILFLLLTSPYSFYYIAHYTESTFLFFTVGAFYMASRKKWALAALMAGGASGTRLQGMILAPALLAEYMSQHQWDLRKIKADILWLLLCPWGLFLYLYHIGGVRLYLRESTVWPQRVFNFNFLTPVVNYFRNWFQTGNADFMDTMSLLMITLCFVLLVSGWKKLRASYRIYVTLSLIMPLLTSTIQAVGRYYTVLFPLYFIAGLFLEKRPNLLIACLVILSMIEGVLIACFTNGYWVA